MSKRDAEKLKVKLISYKKLVADGVVKSWKQFAKDENLQWKSFTHAAMMCRL